MGHWVGNALDPEKRVIHMGDINELGPLVAGAFAQPELAGNGEHLPLLGDFLSFNAIIATLNRQGHKFSFKQVPQELFAGWFPGAKEVGEMLAYFEHIPTSVRTRVRQSRSPTKWPADSRRSLPRGLGRTSPFRQQPEITLRRRTP